MAFFQVLVDDLLVYNGVLPQLVDYSRGILPNMEMPVIHHTILFTEDEDLLVTERNHLLRFDHHINSCFVNPPYLGFLKWSPRIND